MKGPWQAFSEMEERMKHLWEDFPSRSIELEAADFSPSCDFKETKDEYILKFDIPGVERGDIHVNVDNNRLTITGERQEEKEEETEQRHYSESYYGSFMRSFHFPTEVDEEKVNAKYKNGVLTLKIAKTEKSKAKEITIN